MCDYPEFLEEGKYSTLTTLREVAAALTVQSQLLTELAEHGNYVPEVLPSPDQPVILLVIKFAYCGVGKELLQRPVRCEVHRASYTGHSVRDWEGDNIFDSWQTANGEVSDISCAHHAVFWLPEPEHWQQVTWQSWGFPFPAQRADLPVLRHLAFRDDATSTHLFVPTEWSAPEASHD